MTIFALSTGSVTSGISIIRITGDETKNIIKKLTKNNSPIPRKATLSNFYDIDHNEIIDKGIIIWFPGPNSFTGEDLVELHVHGSKAVVSALLSTLSKFENCRLAEPGEFTKIAYENNKFNLLDVEALSDLISSETELQRKQAIKILSGNAEKKYSSLRQRMLKILSYVEAKIDFPEEDLPNDIILSIKSEVDDIVITIQKILDDGRIGEKIRNGFRIVILGPTNAGKSSLINYLSKRDVAIVSEIEGTTRDLLEVNLNLDGYPVLLTDTAGLRMTSDDIEKKGVDLAYETAKGADLKIILLDAQNPDFTDFLDTLLDDNCIFVLNKSDLLTGSVKINDDRIKKFILVSVKNDLNLDELINQIKFKLKHKFLTNDNVIISRERHRLNLEKCIQHLLLFLDNNSLDEFDKAAEDLRLATRYLGKVVGDVDVEEVLGKIFNDFCIGK